MELKKLIKTREFIEETSSSIEHIILKNFPRLSAQEREDIGQEVKLKIWKKVLRGRKIGNLRSYLWKVAYTTALDMINERIEAIPLDEALEAMSLNLFSKLEIAPPESSLDKKESESAIEKSLNSLSESRKMVIKLYLAGMELKEIPGFLGWTRSKVDHLFYRGLGDLKKKLKSSFNVANNKIKVGKG
jgi:RNA polymerase sigma factor (sigma-70 family)